MFKNLERVKEANFRANDVFKRGKYMFFQEEVTAEESTDGEVEAQTYNQDSQDSIGEVSIFEKKKIFISAEIAILPHTTTSQHF